MKIVAAVSSVVFGLVCLMHLLRVVLGVSVVAGSYAVPMWMSVCGVVGAGVLCIANAWAARRAGR